MISQIISLTDTGFNHFLRTGVLDVKPYPGDKLPKKNDEFYVAKCKETWAYGPFYVINDNPKPYAFVNTPSIICEARDTIYKIKIESVSIATIQTIEIHNRSKPTNPPSITGNLELDGLISTAMYDDKLKTYFILILSSNKKLIEYYHHLLNQYNIEHFFDNTGRLFITSKTICNRCIQLNKTLYLSCKEFVWGMMAPNIMTRKPLERILRDTPSEFNVTIILPDTFEYPDINKLEGCGVIVTDSMYGIKRISGLSIRMHPFCDIMNDAKTIEERNEPIIAGMDNYRLGASGIIVRNLLRLSGYYTEEAEKNIIHVHGNNLNYYLLIVKSFNEVKKHLEFFETHKEDGCLLVLNNSQDRYLKIIKNTDVNDGMSEMDLHLFQNMERNEIIPVSTVLASELRHKIHMIWEL